MSEISVTIYEDNIEIRLEEPDKYTVDKAFNLVEGYVDSLIKGSGQDKQLAKKYEVLKENFTRLTEQ